jgi:N-acylneuraminate cytidylyltransferase
MINKKTVLAVIPARGGSKGIPRKNIRMLAGKPLIAWTIEEAKKSKYIDRLILSSEDDEIIKVAKEWGCEVPFVRPAALANDDTPGIEPVLHAINALTEKYDYIMLLQPTSPLRTVDDIDNSLNYMVKHSASVCVSISEVNENPYWMFTLDKQRQLRLLINQANISTRRQDLPRTFMPNGALYIAVTDYLKKEKTFYSDLTIGYIMPKERSHDIDTEIDFMICGLYLST